MEFTKEQQEYIDNLVETTKEGLFTQDELDRQVTAEVDRRVESGIQKGLETHRAKWQDEYDRKARLSAEELAQEEIQSMLDEVSAERAEVEKRANTIDAMEKLTEAGIPKDNYNKFLNLLVSDDKELTEERVGDFIETFESTKKNIESTVRKELSNIPPPAENPDGEGKEGKSDFLSLAREANIRK